MGKIALNKQEKISHEDACLEILKDTEIKDPKIFYDFIQCLEITAYDQEEKKNFEPYIYIVNILKLLKQYTPKDLKVYNSQLLKLVLCKFQKSV